MPSRNVLLGINKELRRQVQGMVTCIKIRGLLPEQVHHLIKGSWSQLRCLDLGSRGSWSQLRCLDLDSRDSWSQLRCLDLDSRFIFPSMPREMSSHSARACGLC